MTKTDIPAVDPIEAGRQAYEQWRANLRSNPDYADVYEEEAAKSALWLQLADARHAVGLTQAELAQRLGVSQAQVARIEKRGYDAYTLNTLRKYVQALGGDYELVVSIKPKPTSDVEELRAAS